MRQCSETLWGVGRDGGMFGEVCFVELVACLPALLACLTGLKVDLELVWEWKGGFVEWWTMEMEVTHDACELKLEKAMVGMNYGTLSRIE